MNSYKFSSFKRWLGHLFFYLIVALILFYILFPIYWMLISSFKSPANLFSVEYWPRDITLINYRFLTFNEPLFYGLYNSIIVSVAVLILTLSIGSSAAYALGRLKFRGQRLIRYATLGMTAFPHIAIVGGLYLLITNPCVIFGGECRQFQLYNTHLALIITYLLLTLPLAIWFLSAYYRSLPQELEEAAYIDGATPFQTFYHILLPLSIPGLITTGLLVFVVSWNEFLFALTFTVDESSQTAPVALSRYGLGAATFALAAAVVLTVPVVVLAIAFKDQITTGLTGFIPKEEQEGGWLKRSLAKLNISFKVSTPEKILGLMMGLALLSFIYHGWNIILFPYPVDYAEGPLLDQTFRLAHFLNIYRSDLSSPPYTVANYPPLYLLVQVPFLWLFGPAYWYGRLVSWVSMVAAATFLSLILHHLTGDKRAALFGGLTLLAVPYAAAWAPLYRIDSLALGLSLAGLWITVRWGKYGWGFGVATILLTAAVYTRQSYGLAAPLAAFVWLLSQRAWYRALGLAALMGILGLGLFAILNSLTQGGFFFNIVIANINEFDLDLLADYLEALWLQMPGLLLVAGLFLVIGVWFRPKSWWLIAPYLAGAALSALTIGKVGSNVNYLLELSAAVSLVIAASLAWQRRHSGVYTGLVLLLALQIFLFLPGSTNHLFNEAKLEDRAEIAHLMTLVRQAEGPVLADEYMGLLPLLGRPIYLQPFEVTQLAQAGLWDQEPLLEAIQRQDFSTILIFTVPGIDIEEERWTPEMLAQIRRYYRRTEENGEFSSVSIYRPKE